MKPDTFEALCDQFLQHGLIFKNYQPATITGYRNSFRLFAKVTLIELTDQLSTDMIEGFLYDGRIKRNWSTCTFLSYHKQLNALCRWCVKKGYIPYNYVQDIEKPPQERRLPQCLSTNECERILEAAYHRKYYCKLEGIRNRAVIAIMIFAGLRLSEVANLKRSDVDFVTRTITVRQGKWSKDRQIPIAARLLFFLKEYLDATPDRRLKHLHFFSSVRDDHPLKAGGIQRLCKQIREFTGIEFSPQKLRHTFATLTYQGSRDIYAVSGLLGHSKVETTKIYAALSLDDKRHSIERHLLNE